MAPGRVISKCHVLGGWQYVRHMMPLTILFVLIVDHTAVVYSPTPLASVTSSSTHRLVMGAWKPIRRANVVDRRPVIKDHIDLPPGFGSVVEWTVHDLNGREVDRGRSVIPETGERVFRWTPDAGRRTQFVLITLRDEHGQYVRGTVVVVPN